MQNLYLKIFDTLFLNVEVHDDVKKTIEQASYVLDLSIAKFG